MVRHLRPNGKGGSKLITFPKEVLAIAELDEVDSVEIEVEKGKIILKKCKEGK